MLGYFSIIGLLRVHVLLGDYTLALQMMNDVELTKKALFTRVNAAHVTVHYYVAFSYIMLRRYPDATRSLTHILYFLQRLKGYHTRGYQFDAVSHSKFQSVMPRAPLTMRLSPPILDQQAR